MSSVFLPMDAVERSRIKRAQWVRTAVDDDLNLILGRIRRQGHETLWGVPCWREGRARRLGG